MGYHETAIPAKITKREVSIMPQAFEKAVWIWRNAPAGRDEFCDFLTTFTAGADTACRLRIAADSNYSVWINGQLAAFGQYADYPDYKVYDEVDVTACTHPGENRMAITVWHYGVASQTYAPGEAGLIFELADADGNILTASGTDTLSRLSRDYISGRCDPISSQLGLTYHYDMHGDDGFRTAGADGFAPSRAGASASVSSASRSAANSAKVDLVGRMAAPFCFLY